MGASDFLRRLGASYVGRVNEQNGNAAADRASSQEADASLMRRAQAAAIMQRLQAQPALDASEIELRKAQSGLYAAHGDAFAHPAAKAAPPPDTEAIMDNAMNVLGYRSKKPGADGRLHFWDNQGQPVPSDGPMVQAPAGVLVRTAQSAAAPQPSAMGRPPIGADTPPGSIGAPSAPQPSPAAVAALASVGGGKPAPSIPSSYRTKAAPRPPQPRQPHLVAGTDTNTGESKFGVAGAPGFAPPLTQVEKTRRDQASHVIAAGTALLAELDRPEVQAIMGPRAGLITSLKDTAIGGVLTGGAGPEATHLAGSMSSMSAFLPVMHGMRGGENMIGHFEHILGKNGELAVRRNPEAVKGAIAAIVESAKRIREHGDNADLTDLTPGVGGPAPGASPSPSATGFRVIGQVR